MFSDPGLLCATIQDQITIENRLNEMHPYWVMLPMQALSLFNSACLVRRNSLKLENSYEKIETFWSLVKDNDSYKALEKMTEIKFVMPKDRSKKNLYRGLPYIVDGDDDNHIFGDDRIYPTALDLFRTICRRFLKSKKGSPIKYDKVMRMWGDFIDFKKIPTPLIWDIDKIYSLLYESADKKIWQDKFLYYGSSVVIEDGKKQERPGSEMI